VLNEGRTYPPRPALQQDLLLVQQHAQPAGGAPEYDTHVILEPVALEAGIGEGFLSGNHPKLGIPIHPPEFLRIDAAGWIEVLDLSSYLNWVIGGIE
jgi:hypothetical protein